MLKSEHPDLERFAAGSCKTQLIIYLFGVPISDTLDPDVANIAASANPPGIIKGQEATTTKNIQILSSGLLSFRSLKQFGRGTEKSIPSPGVFNKPVKILK